MSGPGTSREKREKAFSIHPCRRLIQIGFLVVVLLIGYRFTLFIHEIQEGGAANATRPPGVEAFLPISSLISLKYWVLTGVFNRIHPSGLILFLVILATGIVLKRGFCSWVCPFGLLSEMLSRIHVVLFGKKRDLPRWLDYPLRSLKYLLLLFFLHAVLVGMNVSQLEAFIYSPYNKVADIKMLFFFTRMSQTTFWVLLALVLLSVVVRHCWCRFLCPYGALLGAMSWLSPLKIRRRRESCTSCGNCTAVCPSRIDVHRTGSVFSDECHACLECLDACPEKDALSLAVRSRKLRLPRPVYAAVILLLFVLASVLSRAAGYWQNDIPAEEYGYHLEHIDDPEYTHNRGDVPSSKR